MKEDNQIKTFTSEMLKNYSMETLKISYFYIDKNLTLTKTTEDIEKYSENGKIIVSRNRLNNIIEIPNNIPGKLIFSNEKAVCIQFGKDENCFLRFELTDVNTYELKTNKEKVFYGDSEYFVNSRPIVLINLKEIFNEKTVSVVETGAW